MKTISMDYDTYIDERRDLKIENFNLGKCVGAKLIIKVMNMSNEEAIKVFCEEEEYEISYLFFGERGLSKEQIDNLYEEGE